MFEIMPSYKLGILALDVSNLNDKKLRGLLSANAGNLTEEKDVGFWNYKSNHLSEPGNTLFWEHDHSIIKMPRGAWGSWSFAMPYMTDPATGSSSGHPMQLAAGGVGFRDADFKIANVFFQHPSYGGVLPKDTWGIAVATTNHGPKDKVGITNQPLVAHWLGNQPPIYSRHLFDIQGDSLDPNRHAGLHSAWRVRKWDFLCQTGTTSGPTSRFAIALNGRTAADGTGHLFTTFPDADAHLSYDADGPLRPATDIHLQVTTSDGPIHAGAIDTDAYYTNGNKPFDGPLDFEEKIYPTVLDGITPYKVHLWFDTKADHTFRCGPRKGKWKWFVKLPVSETPKCEPTKTYALLDANSNPQRTYSEAQRLFVPQKIQGSGIYFQGRPHVMKGRP